MHSWFRFVAGGVMLVAAVEFVIALVDIKDLFVGQPAASSTSDSGGSDSDHDAAAGKPTVSFGVRVTQIVGKISSPASLFCLGAMVYLLSGIAAIQEQGKSPD